MSEIDDGGPAFPCEISSGQVYYNHELQRNELETDSMSGMTLRDYFAAKAMGGMLADPNVLLGNGKEANVASLAYEVADAMLHARGAK